jgi:N-formylglutamate deformylase
MKTIFHIPHCSKKIPKKYLKEYLLPKNELIKEIDIMCDNDLDKMIKGDIIFKYSRIFCDVERFNNNNEIMNKVGMGVLYTKTSDLRELRKNPSKDIIKYYDRYHDKFNKLIKKTLETNDRVLIIDLHSYSKHPLDYEIDKNLNRPEICIGINEKYNKYDFEKIIYITNKFGYIYKINEPFCGCLIPSDYMNDNRVSGIMIEIRKDIYDTCEKFSKIKEYLKYIKMEIK